MNSIDNILKYIEKKTEEEICEIKNKTLKECEKILNKSKIMQEHEDKLINEKISASKKQIRNEFDINLKQFEKKEILKAKEEILNRTISLAFKALCEDETLYYKLIKKLLYKNIKEENCNVVFGLKDEAIFKKIFNENFKEINFKKTDEFEHGFKIICEKYILDFNLENIFLENITKIKIKASIALDL